MNRILTALLICLWGASTLNAQPAPRIKIRNAHERKALCNDRSPGVYYFRPGTGTGAKRWVIYMKASGVEGSGDSPLFWPPGYGLQSWRRCENPDFYNANHVNIINCSNDMWSGNNKLFLGRPTEFRGRNIFRSTIQDLLDRPGSTLNQPGTEVLLWGSGEGGGYGFWGSGAGGIGVMVHLDWLAQKLPNVKVRGLNDQGWLLRSKIPGFDYAGRWNALRLDIQRWKSEVNEACALANPNDLINCIYPSAYQYLKTPMFVQATQWDWHWVSPDSSDRTKQFAKDVRRSLAGVPAAFSPQYSIYVVAYRPEFTSLKVNGYSMADLLGNWFFDRAGPVKQISTTPNTTTALSCRGKKVFVIDEKAILKY